MSNRSTNNQGIFLNKKVLDYLILNKNRSKYHGAQKTLTLNYKRSRFFPNLRTLSGRSYLFLSLGLFIKFFTKNKSFLKSKAMYLLLAGFLRKVLLFASFRYLTLIVSKVPAFLKEILDTINAPVTSLYQNPFTESTTDEKTLINNFRFSLIMFFNNKSFGQMKMKKRGRLKRKITKKITQINRILD